MTNTAITLSKTTLAVLKNFASMNSNLHVMPGNIIKTITPSMTGMAKVEVEEEFDTEFGIWDLNKFLGVISLFNNPSFEFHDKYVRISGNNSSVVNYYYSDPSLLTIPTKEVMMPDVVAETTITQEMFNEITRTSSVLQLPDISFQSKDDDFYVIVSDRNDPTSNSSEIKLDGETNGADFSFNFKIDNIKLLPGNYKISFAKKVGRFENENINLTYWFAAQPDSHYNG
jgi:hypothetical protein